MLPSEPEPEPEEEYIMPFDPSAPPPVAPPAPMHPKAGPSDDDVPDYGVVERLTKKLHHHRLIRSCMTCDHFDEPTETCKLYQIRPPARVIAYGCASWTDGLPF